MANTKDYIVNYTINVEATGGAKQLEKFGEAMKGLMVANKNTENVASNLRKLMGDIDKIFSTKNGKKKDYSYTLKIDTKTTEAKLERVKTLLSEISTLSQGINLTLNTTQPLQTKAIKTQAKSAISEKASAQAAVNAVTSKTNKTGRKLITDKSLEKQAEQEKA